MTRFWKLHGLGNDFIFTDPGAEPTPEFIRLICHRVEGVGSDGFIVVEALEPGIATMRMWNPDGSDDAVVGGEHELVLLVADEEVELEVALLL